MSTVSAVCLRAACGTPCEVPMPGIWVLFWDCGIGEGAWLCVLSEEVDSGGQSTSLTHTAGGVTSSSLVWGCVLPILLKVWIGDCHAKNYTWNIFFWTLMRELVCSLSWRIPYSSEDLDHMTPALLMPHWWSLTWCIAYLIPKSTSEWIQTFRSLMVDSLLLAF